MYIHELQDWPRFHWNEGELSAALASVRHRQGRLIGHMEALGFNLRQEAVLQTLTGDVINSSEIEGERLDAGQVRSSIARRLGMDIGALKPADCHVEGIVEMMLDATRRFDQPLTAERLFAWHSSLFPTGRSGMTRIRTGAWHDDSKGPMQVVSGPVGRERVHFEAPKAERLDSEMAAFLDWFETATGIDPMMKAAQAHLWFVTLHPFEVGNGRIGRAIADMALARSENSPQRFYSLSTQIRQERRDYYEILKTDAKGDECQRLVLNRLLDGFEGKLTTSKYAKLAKCSQDTALRDILPLVESGLLVRNPEGGRSTSYSIRGAESPIFSAQPKETPNEEESS
jgi:Fic family protein